MFYTYLHNTSACFTARNDDDVGAKRFSCGKDRSRTLTTKKNLPSANPN
jgi:hypothetical protein